MNWPLFFTTFAMIFVAELPDKTALATLVLAARNKALPVFVGVAFAFVIQTLVAVVLGRVLNLLPPQIVHIAAGILFLGFAAAMWLRKPEAEDESSDGAAPTAFWRAAYQSFIVVFIAEWGDLTQLSTAALVAREAQPVTIFIAAVLALWSVTAIAIVVGHHAKRWLKPAILQKVAAVVFAVVGVVMLVRR
jgi:putative Ca2+/H+ antiporter (TMEM165/GDT1 family)